MEDEEFEWDNAKAAANVAKHGVTFEMAREAFRDPVAVEWRDLNQDAGEVRYALLGAVDGRILFVAYTQREERIRIISARRATSYERRRYHEENI